MELLYVKKITDDILQKERGKISKSMMKILSCETVSWQWVTSDTASNIILSSVYVVSTSHQVQSRATIKAFVDGFFTLLLDTGFPSPEFAINHVVGAGRAIVGLASDLIFSFGGSITHWSQGV